MPRLATPRTERAFADAEPKAKPYKLADGFGLCLLVLPSGSKLWRFIYRRPSTRSRNNLSLGAYPGVNLAEARSQRDELRALLAKGIDPSEQRNAERLQESKRRAEAQARFKFSFAITMDGSLCVTVRGNTLQLTRHQTEAIRLALLATPD